jgi:hypothetical protein
MSAKQICQDFANKHKLIFVEDGEVGFGRACVGFLTGRGNYLDYNPRKSPDYAWIKELYDERLNPPNEVPDAYHKHECIAVLKREGNDPIDQLAKWVTYLESLGELEVVSYDTGADGLQALISGVTGYAIKVKK